MATKIKSPKDLAALQKKALERIMLRSGAKKMQVTVHMGTCGIAAGARDVVLAMAEELTAAGLHDVMLRQSGCAGACSQEPMVTLSDRDGREFRYGRLDRYKARRIVKEHIVDGKPVAECLIQK
jgi:NADP-reducing hydrogenase subunit HndB